MLTDKHVERLQRINSIDALVEFLRDELSWPFENLNVEDITFEYDADELGLKEDHAPTINAIFQIRPLTGDQPWGIFFIDFENKKLPVTIMRRILNSLRFTRTKGKGWDEQDLLFMTTYGEEANGMREVAFAHFYQKAGDLPALHVIQWDAQDTIPKLQSTYSTLREHLGWPPDTANKEAWRSQWAGAFKHRLGHVITTSKALAEKLAELSKDIRDSVVLSIEAESDNGPLNRLYSAFRSALVHDLKPSDFADTFAQTITYGLFTAAVSRRLPEERGSKSLTSETISEIVPETNPFLRELLATFLDVGGRKKGGIDFDFLGVQEVVELLRSDETDMRAILEDFGNRKTGEDPVIHFYEDYLTSFNKTLKFQRGVFYTPQPIVSYIVRSAHEALQNEFGLEDGLASTITWGEMAAKDGGVKIPAGVASDAPFVVILDPAVGTATFLVEVVDSIYRTMREKWQAAGYSKEEVSDLWNEYVPDHLLPRLHGYELMMAPYAIAHLKIGLKLAETGYQFGKNQRVRIYLTNSLEPSQPPNASLFLEFEPLAHEAAEVAAIKEAQRYTVVLGNPPYKGVSANMTDFANALIEPYKFVGNEHFQERKHWLHDDYVKFIRLSQETVEGAGVGIIGFVTNHAYLDNPTFRGMRWNISQAFQRISILDLHGNAMRREANPLSEPDGPVFDIQLGVAITILVKSNPSLVPNIRHGDLWGSRQRKFAALETLRADRLENLLSPGGQYFLFNPHNVDNFDEYEKWMPVNELFNLNGSGVISGHDEFAIDFSDGPIVDRIQIFLDEELCDDEVKRALNLSENYAWRVSTARKSLRASYDPEKLIVDILYRPFDVRRCAFHPAITWRPRLASTSHMLNGRNVGLIYMRQVASGGEYSHFLVTRLPVDARAFYSNKGIMQMAPIRLLGKTGSSNLYADDPALSNFTSQFLESMGNIAPKLDDPELISYVYAVVHSAAYRSRYVQFLKVDYPRIPCAVSGELFTDLVVLGRELIDLHLMEDPRLAAHPEHFVSDGETQVEHVSYSENTVWLNKAKTRGFSNVPSEVWLFQVGGYQVCQKWLKDRGPKKGKPGRNLTPEDIDHYHRIVVALSETIRIMKEIDEVIDAHGGWPGAFQTTTEESNA